MAVNTMNDHVVGVQNGLITMALPPLCAMHIDEALRMAAWIVVIADGIEPGAESKFVDIVEAVRST